MLKAGISTATLLHHLPHRPPMVWIDEVLFFGPEGGECRVQLRADAQYMSAGRLRVSSLVEFIAQAQGFIGACEAMHSSHPETALHDAFLVAISEATFENIQQYPEVQVGASLFVRVGPRRQMGPIMMFAGSVWTSENKCLGQAQLKVYAAAAQPSV